ncbi:hypothetical protein FRC06_000124 [Ceratobasidium sp. 370]|nr:hypothetical protein FRC06_000124 [Ceratobasidium sp. 370]
MSLRRLNLGEVDFDSAAARDEDDEDEGDEEDDEGNAGEEEGEETEGRDASTQNRPAEPGWEHLLSAVLELEEIYLKGQQVRPGLLALLRPIFPCSACLCSPMSNWTTQIRIMQGLTQQGLSPQTVGMPNKAMESLRIKHEQP